MLCEGKHVTIMYTCERGLAMVEIVFALSQLKIEYVDAKHLLDILVLLAAPHVFGDSLCHSVQHALQVVGLTRLLDLNEDNLSL